MRKLETDYLVVGSGAAGMAFTDTLISESDAQVIMIDRRSTPGGHWNDRYPFVRLHQPSGYFGVNSMQLGREAIEQSGPEAGWYDRAGGAEIEAYYARVMAERLLPSGQVRFLGQHDSPAEQRPQREQRVVSLLTGESVEIAVRKRVIDGTYTSPSIPATSPPPFEVAAGATVVPVGQLTRVGNAPERFVIVGAGKTALDACVWLLSNGVEPARIQWIKPRECWLVNRAYAQHGTLVGGMLEGVSLQMEAAAKSTSLDDLFDRLEGSAQLRRVDTKVRPTMYKGATIGDWEIELLRKIEDVVRLGHVERIERDRIVLEQGEVPTSARNLHVHCAAEGLRKVPPLPMFTPERITLQTVRGGLIPFNAALVAFVEAHREDVAEKNRLCPVNTLPDSLLSWVSGTLIQMGADRAWSKEPDISEWLERSRLNPMRGVRDQYGDPRVQQAAQRFAEHARPAVARMIELLKAA